MPTLSIVIPAYNEAARLPTTLESLTRYVKDCSQRQHSCEILVVDDGSRDETADLVRSFAANNSSLRLLQNPQNRGKGYSVRHGMMEARGDWSLFTDADLSTPIEELKALERAAAENRADIVIGSRALDRSLIGTRQPKIREYAGRAFNMVVRVMTGLPFQDTQCGFKLYRREAARAVFSRQKLDGFSFDVEHLVIAQRLGFRIVETPVRWNNVRGTKVSALSGLRSFVDLLQIRWNLWRGLYA